MERRLAAILAADVAGYTHLTELNDETSAATFRAYREVVEEVIRAHRGRVFSRAGDEVVAEFPSVVEAIRCAVEIQHEIADRNATGQEATRMQFRIGVNLGDVIAEEEGLYGTGVNVAARLEQLAEPGGICVSQTVYDQVRRIVEMSFQDMGEVHLKNIADPVRVYRIQSTSLPWFSRVLSRKYGRSRAGYAAVLLLLCALAAAAYLTQPSALRAVLFGNGVDVPDRASIAVLPFDDLSPNGDQQYLADGITDELITGLAKFPDLLIVGSRSPPAPASDEATDLKQLGEELNVRYFVEGSLQRADQNVRVTAQLIEAATGRQIWADRYDRQVSSIFDIRDDIMRSVLATLMATRGKIAGAEVARLSVKDPKSFTAYDYVMRGQYEWSKYTMRANQLAREYFEAATNIDPSYADAYSGLAWTYSSDYDFEWTKDYNKALKLTLEMAQNAVSLDRNNYDSQWVLGWAFLYNHQYEKALHTYERARALNPNDVDLLAEMANMLIYIGQPDKAIKQVEDAIRLNPYHETWYLAYLGRAYQEAGMPQKAASALDQVIPQDPTEDDLWILPTLASVYADPKVGRLDDAHRIVEKIKTLDPEFSSADEVARAPYKDKEQAERFANAMRRAGLPD